MDLERWAMGQRRAFPWRTDAEPLRILVAEILLQRSRGRTVAKVYEELFRRWPDAEALSRARVSTIERVIRPLGLTKRAVTLKALAKEVVARGGVPDTLEELMELPGVGRYAASATLTVGFGQRHAVVDGVSARVYRRYFDLPSIRPPVSDTALWELVEEVTPHENVREWNWAVLDLAALICLPKRPRCPECPLEATCGYAQKPRASEA